MRDGHLLVLGATGSGKTEALRAVATSAFERDELILVADPIMKGSSFTSVQKDAVGFATGLRAAADLMGTVASEVQRRFEFFDDSGLGSLIDLPASVRPKPMLILVDDADALLGDGQAGLTFPFRWSLAEVLSLGRGVDVHVAMAAQSVERMTGLELLVEQFGTRMHLSPATLQAMAAAYPLQWPGSPRSRATALPRAAHMVQAPTSTESGLHVSSDATDQHWYQSKRRTDLVRPDPARTSGGGGAYRLRQVQGAPRAGRSRD